MRRFIQNKYLNHKETIVNFSWRSLQIFGKQGVLFISMFIAAKFLEPVEFGKFAYITSIIIFLATLCDFGVSTSVSRYVSEYNIRNKKKLLNIIPSSLLLVSIISLIIYLLYFAFAKHVLGEYYSLMYYLLPIIFLIPATSIFDGFYRGLKKFKLVSIIMLITGLISLIITYFLIKKYGIMGAIISQSILYFLIFLVFIIFTKISLKFDRKILKKILSYSLFVGFTNMGTFLFNKSTQFLLGKFNFFIEAGYYEIILRIIQIFVITFSILGQVIAVNNIVHKVRGEKNILIYKFRMGLMYSIIFGTFLSIFIYFFFPFLIQKYLPQYNTSVFLLIFQISIFSLPFILAEALLSNGFITPLGEIKVILVPVIAGSLVNIVVGFFLIRSGEYVFSFYLLTFLNIVVSLIKIFWFYQRIKYIH